MQSTSVFFDVKKLAVSSEKLLMSAEVKVCVTWFKYFYLSFCMEGVLSPKKVHPKQGEKLFYIWEWRHTKVFWYRLFMTSIRVGSLLTTILLNKSVKILIELLLKKNIVSILSKKKIDELTGINYFVRWQIL